MKHASFAISKFVAAIVFAVAVIVVVALLVVRSDHGANSVNAPVKSTAPTSPDPVKSSNGGTGDTQPSTTGTSPNGNSSLLSQ